MRRWAARPKSVVRATAEDVAAGRLAPASDVLALGFSGSGSEQEPPRVQFVCLDAPVLQEGELLPVRAGAGLHNVGWASVARGAYGPCNMWCRA